MAKRYSAPSTVLGRRSAAVLRKALETVRPRGSGFDHDNDGVVLDAMLSFLPYLPTPTRLAFPLGLVWLEYGPILSGFGRIRFTRMKGDEAERYLRVWETSKGPRAALFQGVRALALIAFYQQADVLESMEVRWQRRADEQVARRARILDGSAGVETTRAPGES